MEDLGPSLSGLGGFEYIFLVELELLDALPDVIHRPVVVLL